MSALELPDIRYPLPDPPHKGKGASSVPGAPRRLDGASIVRELVRGRAEDPAWVRPAFLAVVVLAAILYVVGLTRSGYANSYYSAAVLAASKSWKAFFFGSVDAGNFITVDKPAGALWMMDLSARLFGVNAWSILLPEALAGVASVALLFYVVRRSFGATAGVIAALVMALTPVAVLMFRYNNPEAMLTLLLIIAAWALLRGIDTGRLRFIVLAAFVVGVAFNTKYLQAYLVLPALIVTFFLAAPGTWRRRVLQLLAAAGVLLVSSGWWLVIVDAIPAAARPYIGGSTNNTVLDLVLGYDGLGRIFGVGLPGPGPTGAGGGFGGAAGWLRLFNTQIGGQISWLLPFAVISLGVGLLLHLRGPRSDRRLAGYVLWGSWLVVSGVIFSLSSGIFHSYYTVQLAPAVAALTGAGLHELWSWRARSWVAGLVLSGALMATTWWSAQLLARTPTFVPWLAPVALAIVVAVGMMLVLTSAGAMETNRLPALGLAAVGVMAMLAGPTAYSLATMGQAFSGGDPAAGPAAARLTAFAGPGPNGQFIPPNGGRRFRGGGPPYGFGGRGFGPGGGAQIDSALTSYLKSHQGTATWIVAVNGANEAASLELSTGQPVMAMGGFLGSDPTPTLTQLKALVHSGQLRYILIQGGGFGGPGGGPSGGGNPNAQSISTWATQNGTQVTDAGNGSLYDLAGAAG